MEKLRSTEPSYIRCVKPNSLKSPDVFDSVMSLQVSIPFPFPLSFLIPFLTSSLAIALCWCVRGYQDQTARLPLPSYSH